MEGAECVGTNDQILVGERIHIEIAVVYAASKHLIGFRDGNNAIAVFDDAAERRQIDGAPPKNKPFQDAGIKCSGQSDCEEAGDRSEEKSHSRRCKIGAVKKQDRDSDDESAEGEQ